MKKTKILIIDDSASVRANLREMLPDSTEIIEAANGIEGLKQVQASHPNLILLDCQMPEMDGIEVYRRLQSHSRFRQIPVVLMSACQEEVIPVLNRLPMDYEFLSKPFKPEQLLRSSHEAMKRARQLREQPPEKSPTEKSPTGKTSSAKSSSLQAPVQTSHPMAHETSPVNSSTAQNSGTSHDSRMLQNRTAEPDSLWSAQRLQQEVQRLQTRNETLEQEMRLLRQQLKQVVKIVRAPSPQPDRSPAPV